MKRKSDSLDTTMSETQPLTENAQPLDTTMSETQQETEEEAQPTTAICVLGEAMFFRPEAHVISITLFLKEQFKDALDRMAVPDSLETMHVVIQNKDVNTLYDGDAIPVFVPFLKAGADFIVHIIVGENEQVGDEEVETVRTSLIMGGLRLESDVPGADGSRTINCKKPGGDDDDDENWDTSSDEEE
jgi:hypothetical protein